MKNPLQSLLDEKAAIVLDGGLATELERRGANLDDPLWSAKALLRDPDLIRQVHRDYFEAGADIITSASYQASFEGFARHGIDRGRAAELMRLSVHLACQARTEFLGNRKAAGPAPLVAASIGCYGATLHDGAEYRGDYGLSVRQLVDWHRPRLEVLAASGADLLACETIPCHREAEALGTLLEEFPEVPAWLSFSCRDGKNVCHGEPLADCVRIASQSGKIVAVGVNCTAPRLIEPLLRSLSGVATKLLIVYPNSGESWDPARRCWCADADPLDWAVAARRWRDAGARLIGGCCRTTPATIRLIKAGLESP